MKTGRRVGVVIAAAVLVLGVLVVLFLTAPRHPVALLRVVDAAGKPVSGAVIQPEGMRAKSGPYQGGWYSWNPITQGVTNNPVTTDANGYARVPYPMYVFERIETGTLCLAVNHPDYVPERPERVVATAPPAGAPWRVRLNDLWDRLQHKALVARADPIQLKRGEILRVLVRPGSMRPADGKFFADVPGVSQSDWSRPEPGVLLTHRLSVGPHDARVVALDAKGKAWFSDVTNVTLAAGVTNELAVELKPGTTVRGKLEGVGTGSVSNGRVVAHVWPTGLRPSSYPPQWHAWAKTGADGSFEIGSLPSGDLELLALCDGFVSTNGLGKTNLRHPQKFELGTNDLEVRIGMERTARLEVVVLDDHGKPLKGARVAAWPNVHYGEWSATILASDCYNSMDGYFSEKKIRWWSQTPDDFMGTSDESGLAVLANLPADADNFAVSHEQYVLPAMTTSWGDKRRKSVIQLSSGTTNRVTVRLERRDESPIRHY